MEEITPISCEMENPIYQAQLVAFHRSFPQFTQPKQKKLRQITFCRILSSDHLEFPRNRYTKFPPQEAKHHRTATPISHPLPQMQFPKAGIPATNTNSALYHTIREKQQRSAFNFFLLGFYLVRLAICEADGGVFQGEICGIEDYESGF